MALILMTTLGALAAVLAVGVLVAATLAPLTVEDSGAAAFVLLGVPVIAAALPPLAQRLVPRIAGYLDLVAAVVIGGWGLLLALGGLGVAFLPSALLLLAGAARSLVPGHRPPPGPAASR